MNLYGLTSFTWWQLYLVDNYHTKLTQQSARSSKLLYANVALFSVGLFSNRSQESSNMAKTLLTHSTATFLFIPHFHVIYGLVLNRSKATWNLLMNFILMYISWA